jgi:hypothetical protein
MDTLGRESNSSLPIETDVIHFNEPVLRNFTFVPFLNALPR